AAPGGADHQDVLGRDLVAQLGRKALTTPAIAQRHRDRALGLGLADDVLVERGDDRLGGQLVVHGIPESQMVSTVTRSLVKTQISAATAMALRAMDSASSS